MTMASSLESNAIDGGIHFRHLQDLFNLFADGSALGNIDSFASETASLSKALRNQVTHDHDSSSQQLTGRCTSQPNWPRSGNIDCGSRSNTGSHGSVIPRGQNIRQTG